MPNATVSHGTEKFMLESLPEAWVSLRKLNYEEVLKRRDGAARLFMEQDTNEETNGDRQPSKMEFETAQLWSRKFEFRACLVDHNLEDDNGRKLDFNNDMTFRILNPRVAIEIEKLIDKLNGEDDEVKLRDFTNAASGSLEATPQELLRSSDES